MSLGTYTTLQSKFMDLKMHFEILEAYLPR